VNAGRAARTPSRGCGPRRGEDPGIVRIGLPPTSGARRDAYRATARLPGVVLLRVFFDADHGGAEGSRSAARAWRAKQLADAALPDPPTRRLVLKPKSNSGIVGVFRRSPRRCGTAAWEANYETSAGECRSRSFSVGLYGEAEARALAVEQRHAWERDDLGCALPSFDAATPHAGGPA
jgi:hypothetical protein